MKSCYNCFREIPDSEKTCPHCGSSADLRNADKYPHALPCGSVLNGKYIVGRVLGQGGFGITYVGQQYDTKQLVAIKEYYPDAIATRDASHSVIPFNKDKSGAYEYGKKQFLDEAKTLAAFIGSPNIVRVYSYFEENGTTYFVMEYVRGKSLRQYVADRGGRISWEETWELLMPVLDALSEVHSKKIIHRDIKPDNIIITEKGRAKLIDFGAARYKHSEKSKSLTAILTPGYAPPEQYYSSGDQGSWTDVYALAATMYFCITGKTPPESIERTFDDRIEKPSSLGIPIPDYAEASLLRALSIMQKDRFGSTYDFRNAVLEGVSREEEKVGVKSSSPDRNEIVIRETKKKSTGGQKPRESKKGSEEPQPRGENAAGGGPQPRGENAAGGGSQPRGEDAAGEGPQSRGENAAGRGPQPRGTKDQGMSGSVIRKKEDAGRPNKIFLAAAIIALIAVVGFVWLNSGRTSKSGSVTGGTEQTIIDSKEIGRQDDPVELTDTWGEIIAAGNDGTYKEKYRIGDTKELDMGSEGIITMKLVAIDEDELADGSGKAPMTWVADELLQSTHNMNSEKTNEGGWEASEMRTWLRETVLPLMPEEVRNNIQEVTKYSYSRDEYKDVTSKDSIWIPSAREVYFSDQRDMVEKHYETAGASYTRVFENNESRIRSRDGEYGASWWWLRSAYNLSSDGFSSVTIDGNAIRHSAVSECGVVIGFCLGKSVESSDSESVSHTSDEPKMLTDTWEEIVAAGRDGTYKERYRIGDTKELDMGPEGIITMKLVAMDEDELADGSGKAPMTWVADELLKSTHNMNSEETNEGGWEASEMRTWLRETVLPLMPQEVRNNIREVIKYFYSYDEQKDVTTKDIIWIPSRREVLYADLSNWWMEKTGAAYTNSFMSNETRKRSRDGESGAFWWWLRSAGGNYSNSFYYVGNNGASYYSNASDESGVVVGFCF